MEGEEYDLSHGSINSAEGIFPSPQLVTKLDLSHNYFSSCRSLSSFVNLEFLNLSHNRIKKVNMLMFY
jgi:Leucine-rich repeat (LRR) protein